MVLPCHPVEEAAFPPVPQDEVGVDQQDHEQHEELLGWILNGFKKVGVTPRPPTSSGKQARLPARQTGQLCPFPRGRGCG